MFIHVGSVKVEFAYVSNAKRTLLLQNVRSEIDVHNSGSFTVWIQPIFEFENCSGQFIAKQSIPLNRGSTVGRFFCNSKYENNSPLPSCYWNISYTLFITSDSVYVETQLLNTTNVEKIIIPEFIVSQKLDENIS